MAESKESTVIAADTYIKGEMRFESSARIQGKFDGKIAAKGELQVAEGAVCQAEVDAGNVIIDGKVEGNVKAGQKLQLNAKASLKGDIIAERLITAEGASIYGHVAVGPDAKRAPEASSGGSTPPPPQPKSRQEGQGR